MQKAPRHFEHDKNLKINEPAIKKQKLHVSNDEYLNLLDKIKDNELSQVIF